MSNDTINGGDGNDTILVPPSSGSISHVYDSPGNYSVSLAVVNANVPDMVGQISHILGENNINIHHMVNESRADIAYTLLDLNKEIGPEVVEKIRQIDGVLAVRAI